MSSISIHMNTLFEKNMDMQQGDFFHNYYFGKIKEWNYIKDVGNLHGPHTFQETHIYEFHPKLTTEIAEGVEHLSLILSSNKGQDVEYGMFTIDTDLAFLQGDWGSYQHYANLTSASYFIEDEDYDRMIQDIAWNGELELPADLLEDMKEKIIEYRRALIDEITV